MIADDREPIKVHRGCQLGDVANALIVARAALKVVRRSIARYADDTDLAVIDNSVAAINMVLGEGDVHGEAKEQARPAADDVRRPESAAFDVRNPIDVIWDASRERYVGKVGQPQICVRGQIYTIDSLGNYVDAQGNRWEGK